MFKLQSRFLYPFFLPRHAHQAATEALQQLTFATRKGDKPVWEQSADVPHFYRDEFLPVVTDFLFRQQDIQYFAQSSIKRRLVWTRLGSALQPEKPVYCAIRATCRD